MVLLLPAEVRKWATNFSLTNPTEVDTSANNFGLTNHKEMFNPRIQMSVHFKCDEDKSQTNVSSQLTPRLDNSKRSAKCSLRKTTSRCRSMVSCEPWLSVIPLLFTNERPGALEQRAVLSRATGPVPSR